MFSKPWMKFYNVAKVMETCPFLNLNEPGHASLFRTPSILALRLTSSCQLRLALLNGLSVYALCPLRIGHPGVSFEWAFCMLLRMYLLCTLWMAHVLITGNSSLEPNICSFEGVTCMLCAFFDWLSNVCPSTGPLECSFEGAILCYSAETELRSLGLVHWKQAQMKSLS